VHLWTDLYITDKKQGWPWPYRIT